MPELTLKAVKHVHYILSILNEDKIISKREASGPLRIIENAKTFFSENDKIQSINIEPAPVVIDGEPGYQWNKLLKSLEIIIEVFESEPK